MAKRMTKPTSNIFLELDFPAPKSSVMLLRAQLAEALRVWMERERFTQAKAAKRLSIAQPRVSEIARGKVELMSLDYLVGLCAKAKVDVSGALSAYETGKELFGRFGSGEGDLSIGRRARYADVVDAKRCRR